MQHCRDIGQCVYQVGHSINEKVSDSWEGKKIKNLRICLIS